MKRPRTPRTHDRAIRALRAQALKCEKQAQGEVPPWRHAGELAWRGTPDEQQLWRFQRRAMAASYSLAAEFLANIVGVVERKPAKRKGRK